MHSPHYRMHLFRVCVVFGYFCKPERGIHLRERQTSDEGLGQHCCQWEMGSNAGSLFHDLAITTLPSLL